jgi:hypothetical protein
MRIGIIDAGMAGLSYVQALRHQDHNAIVFDKSRGPVGRMSTRCIDTPLDWPRPRRRRTARMYGSAAGRPSCASIKAGLVDHLHVAIVPILLERGVCLWDDLRGLEAGYTIHSETAESGTIHLTFRR